MTSKNSITTLITILDQHLFEASGTVQQAREAIIAGEKNLAIGTLLPVERVCEDALAMLCVILSLHQYGRDIPQGGER